MTDRIDHAEEAVIWLENAKRAQASSEPYNEQLATAYAGIAQGHATLALVEQQRIANRIALAGLEMHGPLRHLVIQDGPYSTDVKGDIAAALGLTAEQEGGERQ